MESSALQRLKFGLRHLILYFYRLTSHGLFRYLSVFFFEILAGPDTVLHLKSGDVRLACGYFQTLGLVDQICYFGCLRVESHNLGVVNFWRLSGNLVLQVLNISCNLLVLCTLGVSYLS